MNNAHGRMVGKQNCGFDRSEDVEQNTDPNTTSSAGSNTAPRQMSLARVIFTSLVLSLLGVMLIIVCALSLVFYQTSEIETENVLKKHAEELACTLAAIPNDDTIPFLEQQISGAERITLIAADGSVSFDSDADASVMENHGMRQEVMEAHERGEAVIARRSQTLGSDFLYAAVTMADGSTIRISQIRQSFIAFLGGAAPSIILLLAVSSVGIFLLVRFLTKRIMKPIEAVDPADVLDGDVYIEMRPLFERIDTQHRQLEQQNRELTEAANMRRDFSSNVTHELKSPLQVISGYAELIRTGIADDTNIPEFAGVIEDEACAMRKLIDDILTLSKLDESALGEQRQTVDMADIATRCATRLEPLARERGIAVMVEGNCSPVTGYPVLLDEVVYNLMENAIRYDSEGGSVIVTLADCEAADHGKMVLISVHDTGPGIPEDAIPKVFERFYRLDESRSKKTGGTGLGLAIVKHVVEVHGGTIEVASTLGEGSTFTVCLPR